MFEAINNPNCFSQIVFIHLVRTKIVLFRTDYYLY